MHPKPYGPGFDAVKPRIFQIGFNKCGTRTIYDFLKKNGIKSVHFKRGELAKGISENIQSGKPPLEGWDKWTGYTDMQWVKKTGVIEACGFYREFAAFYPRSYFILNTRSKDRWIKSRLNHGTGQNYGERYRQGLGLATMDETIQAWSDMWDRHHEEVAAYFAKTGQHFLIYNIEEDRPEKLSDFLSPDFQTDPSHFGHEGKTASEAKPDSKTKVAPEVMSSPYVVSRSEPIPEPVKTPPVETHGLSPRFVPHNDLVSFDEAAPQTAYDPIEITPPRAGSTGKLIISVVQNAAPFLLEWIAHHRAIGFDHFLMFSHGVTDGTDQMLDLLAKQGFVTHVPLGEIKADSPHTAALENVMSHPAVFEADWFTCLDTDEFVNVRTGNGTIDCLLSALPKATTNIAMTWRIFGSAGIEIFEDTPTLAQFDRCAPSYLPKPFAAWGFKTMTANIGAYHSMTAHRPGDLSKDFKKEVSWVNGSGADITAQKAKGGWRSDVKTVGYDLVQLNRYPLRAKEHFLLCCAEAPLEAEGEDLLAWTRLDWNDHQDVTIQRNLPRMQAELDRLKQDKTLSDLHASAVAALQDRIAAARRDDASRALADQIAAQQLDAAARVAHLLKTDGKS